MSYGSESLPNKKNRKTELAPLESSREVLSYHNVEEGHLLCTNALKHKSSFFQQRAGEDASCWFCILGENGSSYIVLHTRGHWKMGVVWFCVVGYIGAREGRRGKRKGEGAAIA